MTEIRLTLLSDLASILESENNTVGQIIIWRGGFWEGGKIRASKRLSNGDSRVVFELGGKSHSPPSRVHSKQEVYYGSTALHFWTNWRAIQWLEMTQEEQPP
jgi:hypothetical protein